MRPYNFARPPTTLKRAHLDNLALLPADLLPYKEYYQQLANDLPQGGILIILPEADQTLRQAVEKVATLLEADGHRVTTLPSQVFRLNG